MPIAFSCQSCGRNLRVKDELAGKQIYCPDCKKMLRVPSADSPPDDELVPMAQRADDEEFRDRPDEDEEYRDHRDEDEAFRKHPDEDNRPYPRRRPRDLDEQDDDWDDDDRPRRQAKRRSPSDGSSSGPSSIVGGVVMMIVAVVWFVVGLAFDVIFYYPPILFIIGLVALFKGVFSLTSGRD